MAAADGGPGSWGVDNIPKGAQLSSTPQLCGFVGKLLEDMVRVLPLLTALYPWSNKLVVEL